MNTIKSRKEEEARWRAEDDLRVLTAAEAIRKDQARCAAAAKLAKERLLELAPIAAEKPSTN